MVWLTKSDYIQESHGKRSRNPNPKRRIKLPTKLKTRFYKCPRCHKLGWSKDKLACQICNFKIDKTKGIEIRRYGSRAA